MGNFLHLGDQSSHGDVTKSADRSQGPPILKVVRNRRAAGICISRPKLYPQKVWGVELGAALPPKTQLGSRLM